MQTVLLIDPDVPHAFTNHAAFTEEIEAVTDYLERFSIVGDGLSIGGTEAYRLSTDSRTLGPLTSQPPVVAESPEQSMQAAAQALAPFPEDDHLVIVLTSAPGRWTHLARTSPVRNLSQTPSDRPPVERTFVIDISANSSAIGLGQPPHVSPSTLAASPASRGDLAEAIAQAWVAGFDGGWPTS